MKQKYYVVKKGHQTGIFNSWTETQNHIAGYKGAIYQSFATKEAAELYFSGAKNSKKAVTEWPNNSAIAYVDGSFNKTKRAISCGVLFISGNQQKKEQFAAQFNDEKWVALNNVGGEILGAMKAMLLAYERNLELLIIYHDYQGISAWCDGSWQVKNEITKSYRTFFQTVHEKVKIQFQWVKGHSNDPGNDVADALAKKALLQQKYHPVITLADLQK